MHATLSLSSRSRIRFNCFTQTVVVYISLW